MQWRCPICRKPTDSTLDPDFPFCSPRCRLIDLGKWADESYRVSEPSPACAPNSDDAPSNGS